MLEPKRIDGPSRPRHVHDNHVDGVLKVLHRASQGTLRTRSGTFRVRPGRPDDSGEFLFGIDFVDPAPQEPGNLQVDELELTFQDATFSVGGDAVQCRSGHLLVSRPMRVRSAGLDAFPSRPGRVTARLAFGELTRRAVVTRFNVEYFQVERASFEGIDIDDWDELIPGQLEYRDEHHQEIIAADFVIEDCDAFGNVRLGVIVEGIEKLDVVRMYRRMRFPQLADRGSIDAENVIQLFESSRYIALREACHGPTEAWCCPDFAAALSEDAIYRARDGTLLGHISVTRAYSRTWIGHQLATLGGHRESWACRMALYCHCIGTPVAIDGRDEVFLVSYYDRTKRWHSVFFESFREWLADDDLVAIVPFDRFERLDAADGGPAAPDAAASYPEGLEVEVRECLEHELDAVESLIRDVLPDIACDAFDIDRDRLAVPHLHQEFARRYVQRERRVLVLYEGGQLRGAALLEHSSRHLSLFNLFNMGQLYLAPGVEVSSWARTALLRRVREEFAARGITDPIITAPPGTLPDPEDAGLRLEETMGCIIWTGEALRYYQAYLLCSSFLVRGER